jgi:hypothetical protein
MKTRVLPPTRFFGVNQGNYKSAAGVDPRPRIGLGKSERNAGGLGNAASECRGAATYLSSAVNRWIFRQASSSTLVEVA